MTVERWCPEHKTVTPHTTLKSLGTVCQDCLHTYWRLYERFAIRTPSR